MESGRCTAKLRVVTPRNVGWRIALAAFLVWEAWWAYEFCAAPQPDYEMQTVFAVIMGVFVPAAAIALWLLIRFAIRHSR